MVFDLYNIPLPTEVNVWTSSAEISYEVAAKRLIELNQIMERNKIFIDFYSIRIENPYIVDEYDNKQPHPRGEDISVFDFPREKISGDNLVGVLREHAKLINDKDLK